MKKTFSVSFFAVSKSGNSGLCTNPEDEKTPEGIRAVIDRSNERQKQNDYPSCQYVIIRKTVETIKDDNGVFVCRSTFDNAVEIYPAKADKTPYYLVKDCETKAGRFLGSCLMGTFSRSKAVDVSNHNPGTYVAEQNTGKTIFENPKE